MKGLCDLLGLKFFEKETLLTTGSQLLIPSLVVGASETGT